jgi:arginine repressor
MLVKLAQAHPFSSQAELADAFHAETGITAHPDTFAKALKLAGITRIKLRAKGSFVSTRTSQVLWLQRNASTPVAGATISQLLD